MWREPGKGRQIGSNGLFFLFVALLSLTLIHGLAAVVGVCRFTIVPCGNPHGTQRECQCDMNNGSSSSFPSVIVTVYFRINSIFCVHKDPFPISFSMPINEGTTFKALPVTALSLGSPSTGPGEAPLRRKVLSVVVTSVLLLNTVLLVAMLSVMLHVKVRVEDSLDHADHIMSAVESGDPPPEMLRFGGRLFSSAVTTFFFGASNGTVAGFLQDLMLYNYSGYGSSFVQFTQRLQTAFVAEPPSTAPCHSFNGGLGCISGNVYDAASLINSIASRVAQFTDVTGSDASDPAFSDGLLRLNTLLEWTRAQTNATAWKSAASVCNAFAAQVSGISWYGSYIDTNGNVQTWDARTAVSQVVGSVEEVCGKLVTLT